MNALSNNISLFKPQGTIIEENGQKHQIQQILTDGDLIFSGITSRSLVLILCQNQYESVFFYINAIKRGVVPILIDSQSDSSLLIRR